jgi:signal transduction histidine kinase
VFIRDITERKNMQKQLKEYSEHLEEKMEERTNQLKKAQEQLLKSERLAAIGEVATMVGHDLRNPLQAITNAVYFLKNSGTTVDSVFTNEHYEEYLDLVPEPTRNEFHEKLAKDVEIRSEMINAIDESIKYADKIVSDLQDFARNTEPEPIEINLESLIQETLSGISIPKNVKISMKHDQRLSKVYVDPNQFRRVFTNLTTNAIQAMENGGTLTISTNKTNGFLEVSFKDTGVGIPKENMKKLFHPLFTTKAKGMGMGLPICKKLVEMHGGTMKVESEIGKGTTVTVKLPITKENGGEKT